MPLCVVGSVLGARREFGEAARIVDEEGGAVDEEAKRFQGPGSR